MNKPTYCAPGAQIYGDVRFGEGVTIWPNAVIRAESSHVEVGDFTNIQDFCMLHIGGAATVVGAYCSITHHATLHGAVIGDNCLIGINATIMDGAEIGENSIVAGNSIVREGTIIPPNSVVAGVPAKVIATKNNYAANKVNAIAYHRNGLAYTRGEHRLWADPDHQEEMRRLLASFEHETT